MNDVTLTISINEIYRDAAAVFFREHGCQVEGPIAEDARNRQFYRVTCPPGTCKTEIEPAPLTAYSIWLPDGTELEERAAGAGYSFLNVEDL